MNDEILIGLNDIHPNPYQPRKGEDMEAVIELAENIKRNATDDFDGLLQVPTVRLVPGKEGYDMAFGHTRLAAFKYLFEQGKTRYGQMRCAVRDLSDLQMFELAVSENIKRRDLNPIEQAEALDTYMTKFEKNSVEAAEFFNIAPSTIRGAVRLLSLPEEAQAKIRSGDIRTTEARALMVVDKLIGEEGVRSVLDNMQDDHQGPIDAIENVMRWNNHGRILQLDSDDGWVKANPFPMKHLAPVTMKDLESIDWTGSELEDNKDLAQLFTYVQAGMIVTDEAYPMFSPDALEKVRILVNPPGCETCPLHAVLDGDHYCGFKLCSQRKDAAWKKQEAENISAELSIPLYEKSDGVFVQIDQYQASDKKLFAARHADLRLMPAQNMFNNFEGLGRNLKMVAVGELAEKRKAKQEKKAEKAETIAKQQQPDYELERRLNSVSDEYKDRFVWEVASRVFTSALDGVTNLNLLMNLNQEFSASFPDGVDEDKLIKEIAKAKKPEALKGARRLVMMGMLDRHGLSYGYDEKKIIVKYAAKIAELAKEWGVKLPKDWTTQVEKYQAEVESARKEVVEKRKAEG